MSPNYPIGEEIWVRRDTLRRGVPFYCREYLHVAAILIFLTGIVITPLPLVALMYNANGHFSLAFILAFGLLIPLIMLATLGRFMLPTLHRLSTCPVWYYAEQLNPETLTIHHLRKPSTQLQLAESTIQERTFLKHYTTITLTDKDKNSATLHALTPEETDRFMAYWNAANPSKTPQLRASHESPTTHDSQANL